MDEVAISKLSLFSLSFSLIYLCSDYISFSLLILLLSPHPPSTVSNHLSLHHECQQLHCSRCCSFRVNAYWTSPFWPEHNHNSSMNFNCVQGVKTAAGFQFTATQGKGVWFLLLLTQSVLFFTGFCWDTSYSVRRNMRNKTKKEKKKKSEKLN